MQNVESRAKAKTVQAYTNDEQKMSETTEYKKHNQRKHYFDLELFWRSFCVKASVLCIIVCVFKYYEL